MKFASIAVGVALLGYLAWTNFKPAVPLPPPPPPPAPPPMLAQAPPMVLDSESLARVRASANDTDPTVRWEAVQFLMSSHDPQADEIIFSMLHRDSDPNIRKKTVMLLSNRRGRFVVEQLLKRLTDSNAEVRLAVLNAMTKIGDYTTADAISSALHDSDKRVRLAALQTLNALQAKRDAELQATQKEHQAKMRAWEEQVRQNQPAQ